MAKIKKDLDERIRREAKNRCGYCLNRLKSAMSESTTGETVSSSIESETVSPLNSEANHENLVETTKEELEGFYIVKSLLRDIVDPNRIVHRDTQSYMGILLEDNNRKPLADCISIALKNISEFLTKIARKNEFRYKTLMKFTNTPKKCVGFSHFMKVKVNRRKSI